MAYWNQAFGGPARNSTVNAGPTSGPLYCRWYVAFEPYIHPNVQPIMDESGNVYVASSGGLFKLSSSDGKLYWQVPGNYASTPAHTRGRIVVAGMDHRITCLDSEMGRPVWQFEADAPMDADLLRATATNGDPRIVIGDHSGKIYCLNAQGSLQWTFQTEGPICCGAAAFDGNVYVLSNDMHLYKLGLLDGELMARSAKLPGEGFWRMPPVVDTWHGKVYVPCSNPVYKMGRYWTPYMSGREAERRELRVTDDGPYTYLGATRNDVEGPWPAGTVVMDMTRPNPDLSPAPESLSEYIGRRPYRVSMVVLDSETLAEASMESGGRAPWLAPSTYSGSRQGPIIDLEGQVFVDQVSLSPGRARWHPWKKYTAWIGAGGLEHACDEPQFASCGNGVLHAMLSCGRTFASWDPNTGQAWTHSDDTAPGQNASRYDRAFDGNDPALGGSWRAYGGLNGVYGQNCSTGIPVPFGAPEAGKVLILVGNSLLLWTLEKEETRQANLVRRVPWAGVPPIHINAQARLEEEIAKVLAAGHLRPGWTNHGKPDIQWNHPELTLPNLTVYGKYVYELLLPLLSAYRHTRPQTRTKLRQYIKDEFRDWTPPRAAYVPDAGGAPREWCDLPEDAVLNTAFAAYEVDNDDAPWRISPLYWYLAWRVVEVLAPDPDLDPKSIYQALALNASLTEDLKTLARGGRDALFGVRSYLLNANLAGLYGRMRLAQAAGDKTGADDAEELLNRYVQFWADHFTEDTPYAAPGRDMALRALNVTRNWLWLVPEVGSRVRKLLPKGALDHAIQECARVAPYWFLGRMNATLGESQTHHFLDRHMFGPVAWFTGATQEHLSQWLDAPVFRVGDGVYIQNLATFLDAPLNLPPGQSADDVVRENSLLRDESRRLAADLKRAIYYAWHSPECDLVQNPGAPCNCQGSIERDLVTKRWEGKR